MWLLCLTVAKPKRRWASLADFDMRAAVTAIPGIHDLLMAHPTSYFDALFADGADVAVALVLVGRLFALYERNDGTMMRAHTNA